MKIKTIFLSILMGFSFSLTYAQSVETKESLEKDLNTYVEIVEKKDFSAMLDFMPPKFFEKVPKETMMEGMEQAFNNPDVKLEMYNFKVLKVHPLVELKEGKYTLVDYSFTLKMEMVMPEDETEEEVKESMDFTKSMLEMQHGEGSVVFDEENNSFTIDVSTTMYAMSESAYEGWKFIEKKENMASLMGQLIPQEAIDALK